MSFTYFTDNQIFVPYINRCCDIIYNQIEATFGTTKDNIYICGSVGRVLAGDTNLRPKDLDFVIPSQAVYRHLNMTIHRLFPNFDIKRERNRLIIYTAKGVIELWVGAHIYGTGPYNLDEIQYILTDKKAFYANKIT